MPLRGLSARGAAGPLVALVAAGLAAVIGPAAPAATPGEVGSSALEGLGGAVTAGFVHGVDSSTAERAAGAAGLEVVDRWDEVDVAVAAGTAAQWAAAAAEPGVVRIERDRPLTYSMDTSHTATRGAEVLADSLNYHDAGGQPLDGRGVSVAIIDTGVDGNHAAFRRGDGSSKVVVNLRQLCEGVVCEEWLPAPGNDSDTTAAGGHGTHVAGTAAGSTWDTINGPLHGAAPGAEVVALSHGAYRSILNGAAGLRWVLQHHADPCGDGSCPPIRVINNSWGSGGAYDPGDVISKLQDALVNVGVVVVWAAGNGGGNGSADRVTLWAKSPTPGVIGVANYDDANAGLRDNAISSSSSRGLSGDPTTYPDLAAPGSSIRSSCRLGLAMCGTGGVWGYSTFSGTSMAAPHVAGIVAQLLQADPSLTPADIEDLLEDTAHPFTAGAAYENDPRNADHPTSFDKGHGLVDAVAAVQRVLGAT